MPVHVSARQPQLTQGAVVEGSPERHVLALQAPLGDHRDHQPTLPRGTRDAQRVTHVQRERLLDHDVPAGLERRQRERRVGAARCADRHDVDLRVRDDLVRSEPHGRHR
jgi:hypothetical protein